MDALNALLEECDVRLDEVAEILGKWCDGLEDWSNSIESQYPHLTSVTGLPVVFVFILPLIVVYPLWRYFRNDGALKNLQLSSQHS